VAQSADALKFMGGFVTSFRSCLAEQVASDQRSAEQLRLLSSEMSAFAGHLGSSAQANMLALRENLTSLSELLVSLQQVRTKLALDMNSSALGPLVDVVERELPRAHQAHAEYQRLQVELDRASTRLHKVGNKGKVKLEKVVEAEQSKRHTQTQYHRAQADAGRILHDTLQASCRLIASSSQRMCSSYASYSQVCVCVCLGG
jgi:uncharacterized protein (DUF342 family)